MKRESRKKNKKKKNVPMRTSLPPAESDLSEEEKVGAPTASNAMSTPPVFSMTSLWKEEPLDSTTITSFAPA